MIDMLSQQFARANQDGILIPRLGDRLYELGLHASRTPRKFESEYLHVLEGFEAFRFKFLPDYRDHHLFKRIDMNPNYRRPDGQRAYPHFDDFLAAAEHLGIPHALSYGWTSRVDYCVDLPLLPRFVIRGLEVDHLIRGNSFDKGRASGPDGYRLGSTRSVAVYDRRPIANRNIHRLGGRTEPKTRVEVRFKGGAERNPQVPRDIRRMTSLEQLRQHARTILEGEFDPFRQVRVHKVEVQYPSLPDILHTHLDLNDPYVRGPLMRYLREYPDRHRIDVMLDTMSLTEMKRRYRDETGLNLLDLPYLRLSQGVNLNARLRLSLNQFFFGVRPRMRNLNEALIP